MTTKIYDDETGNEIKEISGVEVSVMFEGDNALQTLHFAAWEGASKWLQGAGRASQRLLLVTIRDRSVKFRNDPRSRPAPIAPRP